MGLIGDPRTAVSPPGAPDRVGILDADTGVLRIVPTIEADTTVAAWVAGAWLITRESMTPSTGCGQNTDDCESWKLYDEPVDLKSAPVLLAASVVPGPIIDEAAPVSDGKTVVWQRLNATGTFSLEEASLDSPGNPRTLTESAGPAIQLALDGLGNVVVDEPTDASGVNTQLMQVNLSTGASAPLSIRNAHYPSVRSQQMLDVTGTDGSLTVGELRRYPPPPDPEGKPRVVFQTGDLYDLQFLTDTLALAIDSNGVSVVNLVSGTSSRLAVRPIARGRVSGSGNVLEMLVATPRGTEAIIEADPE